MEENNNEELSEVLEQLKREESEEKIESYINKKGGIVLVWTIIGICFIFLSIPVGIWLFTADQKLLGVGLIALSILTIIGIQMKNKIIKNIFRVIAIMGIIGILRYIILMVEMIYIMMQFFAFILNIN